MRPTILTLLGLAGFIFGPAGQTRAQDAKADEPAPAPAAGEKLPGPPPIPEVELGPKLKTTPRQRRTSEPNVTRVDAKVLPRDKEGIWVLDFAFKPVRLMTVDTPGKGRRQVHYLYYRVVNRTKKPRMFVPQFTLITDSGKKYDDVPLPQAVDLIRNREDPNTPVFGAVDVMGIIPPSKESVDDAITGVAIWEGVDPKADAFQIFVRGLSDGYQIVNPPGADAKPVIRHKTLRLDFTRFGDERNLHEREIQLGDPPYDWIYW